MCMHVFDRARSEIICIAVFSHIVLKSNTLLYTISVSLVFLREKTRTI